MKLILTMLAFIAGSQLFAQSATGKIKVLGECGMCENRIEKAAKTAGATRADWNDETKMLTVTFDSTTTSLAKIEQAIAAVGHDTEHYKGNDAKYKKLPSCCKYERKTSN
jgi:periplasmic mercuric ion binding protein